MSGGSATGTHPCRRRPWRWREREWIRLAVVAVAAGLLFTVWPEIDLWASRAFFDGAGSFAGNEHPLVMSVYAVVPWFGRAAALLALGVVLVGWARPQAVSVRWRHRAAALGLTLLVGTGIVVNAALKEHWGRARPRDVAEFGGHARFEPALLAGRQCERNCSFVSGHAATGFALMSVGMMAAPARRRRWFWVGVLSGLAIGVGRIAQGGHFASDIVFAGLAVWASHAAVREGWLAWRAFRRRRGRAARSGPR